MFIPRQPPAKYKSYALFQPKGMPSAPSQYIQNSTVFFAPVDVFTGMPANETFPLVPKSKACPTFPVAYVTAPDGTPSCAPVVASFAFPSALHQPAMPDGTGAQLSLGVGVGAGVGVVGGAGVGSPGCTLVSTTA
ncbi:Uncharacterised protein [uncultured archaeon]|nr:Uncharacterised protein [uncultured archaeon]